MTAAQLFDDFQRSDDSARGQAESMFQFLNRVKSGMFEAVRQTMQQWLDQLPPEQKADVRSRFRSNVHAGRQSLAAFWELYLHETFRRLGFEVTPHPVVPGSGNRPDYLLERHGEELFLEATVVGKPEQELALRRRMEPIYQAVNSIQSPNFFLDFEIEREGTTTPSLRRIQNCVSGWLANLDPDVPLPDRTASSIRGLPGLPINFGDWTLIIRAIPKKKEARGEATGRTIGMGPTFGGVVDDYAVIRDRIREKTKRYGEMPVPHTVALLSARHTTDRDMWLQALFGAGWEYPGVRRSGVLPQAFDRAYEGLWVTHSGPYRQDVAAVIAAVEVRPWTAAWAEVHVFHNPWADRPLNVQLPFGQTRVDLATGELIEIPPAHAPHVILNLPEDWPPGWPNWKDQDSSQSN